MFYITSFLVLVSADAGQGQASTWRTDRNTQQDLNHFGATPRHSNTLPQTRSLVIQRQLYANWLKISVYCLMILCKLGISAGSGQGADRAVCKGESAIG